MRRMVFFAIVPVALILVGCGDSESGQSEGAVSVEDAAARLGCSDTFQRDDSVELFVADAGRCTIGSASVYFRDFGTQESRENWWKAAREFGSAPEQGVELGLVYVEPDSRALLPQVRAALLQGSPPPTATSLASALPSKVAESLPVGTDEDFITVLERLAPDLVLSDETNAELADLGRQLCDKWDGGASDEDLLVALTHAFTADEAAALLNAAATAYCPAHQ